MHYYKRNIGDYHKKAGRLSMLEHGAYTLLIDACYDREVFPTKEQAIDWCWARSADEVAAVEFVLSKFFECDDGVHRQLRIEEDLAKYHENSKTNKRIAKEREAKRKLERERSVNEAPPNHKPLTTNQEPVKNTSPNGDSGLPAKPQDNCPHEKIIDLYHKNLPALPVVKVWTAKRKSMLQSRWREDSKRQDLDWWDRYFKYVSESDLLMGNLKNNDRKWRADLEWLVGSSNLVKVIEGKYHA